MNLTLELSGLNLERLLRAAGECGVRMKTVRRVDGRTMRVVVPAAQKRGWPRSAKIRLADGGNPAGGC